MIDKIGEFLASLPKELYVFLISILPIIELRGSIPIGAALGIPFYLNYGLSVLGNLLPIPFILMFIPIVLDFLGKFKFFRPMVEWLRKKAEKNKGKIIKEDSAEVEIETDCDVEAGKKDKVSKDKKRTVGILVGLMLFVAVPLPGTGAWTGSLVAALFGLPKRGSFFAVALGVMISGVIMCLASYGILGFLSFLL